MPSNPILCLTDTLGKGGGAEHLIATLAPRLRQLGLPIEVGVLKRWPIHYEDELAAAGVPVHRLYQSSRIGSTAALARQARTGDYALFWGHLAGGNAHARLAAALTGGKSIVTLHSQGPAADPPHRLRDRVATAWRGYVMGGAHARIAVSAAVARDHQAWYGWQDIIIADNGIDIDLITNLAQSEDRITSRARWGIGADEFLIVTPARFIPLKGQIYLLEALARLQAEGAAPIRLFLCGEGAAASRLHADIARLGLQTSVIITDVIEQPKLIPLLASADLCVMPSLQEAFGIAAAEAMALAVPTIVTQAGGLIDLAADSGTALIVPPGDATALARNIISIRNDPERARFMGEAAAKRVARRFSMTACAQRWAEILDCVANERPVAPCAA